MDWTPLPFYGASISVPANSTIYVILYPLPDYSVGDAEYLIEDKEEINLFPERIVGDVYASGNAGSRFAWQLMPLGVDYDTPAVLPPYTTDWQWDDPEWANLRWWTRRCYTIEGLLFPDLFAHPYWTSVDINPRQGLGAQKNLWPVLCAQNMDVAIDARITHTLRGLWK